MFSSAISLFLLRKLPFVRFDFPRWKTVLAVSLIGLLAGLDPSLRTTSPDIPVPPLAGAGPVGLG